MIKTRLQFTNIEDNEIYKMLEKDLEIEMYDKEKDIQEDWGPGRTSSTCIARLSEIHEKKYLHIISKNQLVFGKENRIYSYDMNKKNVCTISKIKKNISDETYKAITNMYYNK